MGWLRINRDLEEVGHYRENTHKYYRITPRTAYHAFIFLFLIPVGLYAGARASCIKGDKRSSTRLITARPRTYP